MQHPPAANIRAVSAYYCCTAPPLRDLPPPPLHPEHTFMTSLSVMSSGKRLSEHVWRSTPYRNEKWERPPPCRFSISPPTWLIQTSVKSVEAEEIVWPSPVQAKHTLQYINMYDNGFCLFPFSIDYYRPETISLTVLEQTLISEY